LFSIVMRLIWIHFSVWISAAFTCNSELCLRNIGCCKARAAHTVRIGIQRYLYDIVYDIIIKL
jgi:hypothetical protein